MDAILETRNLTRRFGGLVAVNDMSLCLQPAEVRGLIGPNGSGKTTLINLISGVYEPSSGDVYFKGDKITAWSPNRIAHQGILRTFQVPRLFGNMTVLENMFVPRFADFRIDYRREYPAAKQKACQLLEMTGLSALQDRPAKILSGGQKALLQIVRGFMVDGLAVYLLDEPFAGVNMVVKETIMHLIEAKRAEGLAFLLVSHEMPSVRRMCSKITVMAEGAVIAEGSMEQVAANEQVINAYLGGKQ